MSGFRGSDGQLDREIATTETIARLRLRRYAREMAELERELRELRKIRIRRQAELAVDTTVQESASATAD